MAGAYAEAGDASADRIEQMSARATEREFVHIGEVKIGDEMRQTCRGAFDRRSGGFPHDVHDELSLQNH